MDDTLTATQAEVREVASRGANTDKVEAPLFKRYNHEVLPIVLPNHERFGRGDLFGWWMIRTEEVTVLRWRTHLYVGREPAGHARRAGAVWSVTCRQRGGTSGVVVVE